jgi:hypothetical protein
MDAQPERETWEIWAKLSEGSDEFVGDGQNVPWIPDFWTWSDERLFPYIKKTGYFKLSKDLLVSDAIRWRKEIYLKVLIIRRLGASVLMILTPETIILMGTSINWYISLDHRNMKKELTPQVLFTWSIYFSALEWHFASKSSNYHCTSTFFPIHGFWSWYLSLPPPRSILLPSIKILTQGAYIRTVCYKSAGWWYVCTNSIVSLHLDMTIVSNDPAFLPFVGNASLLSYFAGP